MNTSIWKFDLIGQSKTVNGTPHLVIEMPKGSKILCVHEQGNRAHVWVACDPAAPKVDRGILIQGTGDGSLVKPDSYIGSVFLDGGAFVFHFFDEGEL